MTEPTKTDLLNMLLAELANAEDISPERFSELTEKIEALKKEIEDDNYLSAQISAFNYIHLAK